MNNNYFLLFYSSKPRSHVSKMAGSIFRPSIVNGNGPRIHGLIMWDTRLRPLPPVLTGSAPERA